MSEDREMINLKVMRLSQPEAETQPTEVLKWALLEDLQHPDTNNSVSPFFGINVHSLLLPVSLGSVYQGESFHAFVHLSNPSKELILSVTLHVDLRCGTTRHILFDNTEGPLASLPPEESFCQTILQPLSEAGSHILVCVVTLRTANQGEQNIRREYKFDVIAPLQLSHRVHRFPDYSLVEVSLLNVSKVNILVREAVVACAEEVLGYRLDTTDRDATQKSLKGLCYLKAAIPEKPNVTGDAFTLLFSFHSTNPNSDASFVQKLTSLGHLKLTWSSRSCDSAVLEGYALTAQLERSSIVELRVVKSPISVVTETEFNVTFEVINRHHQQINSLLGLDFERMSPFFIQGADSTMDVGPVEAYSKKSVTVSFVLTRPGLHTLSGITVQNLNKQVTLLIKSSDS
eukprot:GHVN01078564.1.p1 GENE.GHVN01078564.1~~GHVN01078564.1.p1  ORF type:complete len:411 (-),score=40.10 GHVN01078564.1:1999-3201(-)